MTALVEQATLNSWRGLPWRMFTRCVGCGVYANCAGKRRASMRCFECHDAREARRG